MKRTWQIVGGLILGLLLLASFDIDWSNTQAGGSIDLRNRITGARLFAAGIDAYHYKWHTDDPQEYCDPYNNLAFTVSKTTATPASLLLHVPLAELNYRTGQFVWLIVQWLLLLGTAALWLMPCPTSRQRWLVAWAATAFTYTAAWRLHAERGQVYVLLLFLFAGWLSLTLHAKWSDGFWAGILAGFLVAMRPPFILLAPFLALHRRGQLIGALVGLAAGIGGPLALNPASWTNYYSAMHENAAYYGSGQDATPPPPQGFPGTVEGIPLDTVAGFATIPFADFSVHALLHRLGIMSFPELPVTLAGVIPFGIWLWLWRGQKPERLLPGLCAWFFLIDLFLPTFRNNYNDVLILNVVALGLISAPRIPWGVWPCLAALPVGWYVYAEVPYNAWLINLPSALYTTGAIFFVFFPEKISKFYPPTGENGRHQLRD